MHRKKPNLSAAAIALSLAALAVSLFALLRPAPQTADYAGEIEALQEYNEQLQARLNTLEAQLQENTPVGLSGWELTCLPLAEGEGASVTLTAVPEQYEEGMQALFSIRLYGKEVASIPCVWDGEAFTAAAELPPEDGYGYFCLLEDAAGEKQQYALTTPENPVVDVPVYLASSLSAYCNMTVESWFHKDDILNLSLAYVQAQLPRLTAAGEAPGLQSAQLRLHHNGEFYSTVPLTLEEGQGPGAYELHISGLELTLPKMATDDYLELYVEITLSDGRTLSEPCGTWYSGADGLFDVMG